MINFASIIRTKSLVNVVAGNVPLKENVGHVFRGPNRVHYAFVQTDGNIHYVVIKIKFFAKVALENPFSLQS